LLVTFRFQLVERLGNGLGDGLPLDGEMPV
jgi:hypothetical protein